MMKSKVVQVVLAGALLTLWASSAQAGFINITPGQWATFNAADTNCSKTTKTNAAGEPVSDVISCPDTGGEFQITTIIPQNANPTAASGWNVEYNWKCADGDTCLNAEKACINASHVICVGSAATPEDCEDLAFVNVPANGTQLDMVTADIGKAVKDSQTDFLTAAALEHGVAVACTTSVCDGEKITLRFVRGTQGTCTDDLTGGLDIESIIVTYPED